jgi:hypothetical protein
MAVRMLSKKSTAYTYSIRSSPKTYVIGINANSAALPRSVAIIMGRFLCLSTHKPAMKPATAPGALRKETRVPICSGEAPRASTTVNCNAPIRVSNSEIVRAAHSFRKSELRRKPVNRMDNFIRSCNAVDVVP